MVKVGIIGADNKLAGELIRILINHPETELTTLYAPSLTGYSVTTKHHGLVGETPLFFTDKINPDELDLIILLSQMEVNAFILSKIQQDSDLKIISLDKQFLSPLSDELFQTGLSEINRKALVRGAKVATIPSPAITPSLIALIPLANFLLLNSDINIELTLPEDIEKNSDTSKEILYLQDEIKKRQASFNNNINIKTRYDQELTRGQITTITIKNSLDINEIIKIYESIYDDHNFTFLSSNDINTKEVAGTQKVIIFLSRQDDGFLNIKIVSDPRMRGGAGDITHILNLFFGLHEKTGLILKTSQY